MFYSPLSVSCFHSLVVHIAVPGSVDLMRVTAEHDVVWVGSTPPQVEVTLNPLPVKFPGTNVQHASLPLDGKNSDEHNVGFSLEVVFGHWPLDEHFVNLVVFLTEKV